jgi:hypothetical protein
VTPHPASRKVSSLTAPACTGRNRYRDQGAAHVAKKDVGGWFCSPDVVFCWIESARTLRNRVWLIFAWLGTQMKASKAKQFPAAHARGSTRDSVTLKPGWPPTWRHSRLLLPLHLRQTVTLSCDPSPSSSVVVGWPLDLSCSHVLQNFRNARLADSQRRKQPYSGKLCFKD